MIQFYENELEERDGKIETLDERLSRSRAENKHLREEIDAKNQHIEMFRKGIEEAISILETRGFISGQNSRERALEILKDLIL